MFLLRSTVERLPHISPLLLGLLVPACSIESVPTDPLESASPAGGILGLVTADGAPVSGVTVTLSRSGAEVATVITTGNGEFGFRGLDAGTYVVAISEIAGMSCTRVLAATIAPGEKAAVSFACSTPAAPITVGTVEGRVTVNGVGAERVLVSIGDSARRTGWRITASDGSYRFPDVPTGARSVWIVTEEACPGTHHEDGRKALEVTVPEDGTAVADFACTGQAITGHVTVNGIPVSGFTVRACTSLPDDEGCFGPSVTTEPGGRYADTSLRHRSFFPPGDYIMFVQGLSDTTCPARLVPVPSGEPVTVDFDCVHPGPSPVPVPSPVPFCNPNWDDC